MKKQLIPLFVLIALSVVAGVVQSTWTTTGDAQTARNGLLGTTTAGKAMKYDGANWTADDAVHFNNSQFDTNFTKVEIKPSAIIATPKFNGVITQSDGTVVETHTFWANDITDGTATFFSYPYQFSSTYSFDIVMTVIFDDSSPEGAITAHYTVSANTDLDSVDQVSVSPVSALSETTAGAGSSLAVSVGDDGAGNFVFSVTGVPTAVIFKGIVRVIQ